jgi:hypothetical protein
MDKLKWGLGHEVPDNAVAAWGARAIDADGFVDLLPDRIDVVNELDGFEEQLLEHMTEHFPIPAMREACRALPRSDEAWTIYESAEVTYKARRYGGYFYLACWMVPVEVQDQDDPIIESPSGWSFRQSQENGDGVGCAGCGNLLNDDLPIANDAAGFARHEGCPA